jgi:hypothetical protein
VKKLCIKDVPYTNEDSVEEIEYRVFEYNYLRYLYVEKENKFLVQWYVCLHSKIKSIIKQEMLNFYLKFNCFFFQKFGCT